MKSIYLSCLSSLFFLSSSNAVSPTHPKIEETPQQEQRSFKLESFEADKDKLFLWVLNASSTYQELISKTCGGDAKRIEQVFKNLLFIYFSKNSLFNEVIFNSLYTMETIHKVYPKAHFKKESSLLTKSSLKRNDAFRIISSRLKELAAEVSFFVEDDSYLTKNLLGWYTRYITQPYEIQGDQSYFFFTTMLWQRLILPGFEKQGIHIINNPKNQEELEKKLSILGLKSLEFEAKAESPTYTKKSILGMQGVFYRIFFLKEEDGFGIEGFKVFMQILFDIDESIMEGLEDNSHLLAQSNSEPEKTSSSFLSSIFQAFTSKAEYEKLPQKAEPAAIPTEKWRDKYSARQQVLLALIEQFYGKEEKEKIVKNHEEALKKPEPARTSSLKKLVKKEPNENNEEPKIEESKKDK